MDRVHLRLSLIEVIRVTTPAVTEVSSELYIFVTYVQHKFGQLVNGRAAAGSCTSAS